MKLNYLLIPLIVVAVWLIGGSFTEVGIGSGWYAGILKPDWTPVGEIIGTAWLVIYLLVTLSLLILWNRTPHDARFRRAIVSFSLNAVLNVSWSYFFFVQHMIGVTLVLAILLWFSVLELIVVTWPVKKVSALLLVPYAAWLMFAIVLNYTVFRLN